MPTCIPIKDMKDTAAFTRCVEEARGPVTVTRNGHDAFVVMCSADYKMMQDELAQARLTARVARAENEYACGKYADGAQFLQDFKAGHGL